MRSFFSSFVQLNMLNSAWVSCNCTKSIGISRLKSSLNLRHFSYIINNINTLNLEINDFSFNHRKYCSVRPRRSHTASGLRPAPKPPSAIVTEKCCMSYLRLRCGSFIPCRIRLSRQAVRFRRRNMKAKGEEPQ